MSTAQYTIETRVGRLIEARVFELNDREETDAYSATLAQEVRRHPRDRPPVLCADHRPVRIYPQAAADRLIELFQDMNSRLARIAILVSPSNATILMQLERIVREAGYENRRVFRATAPALTHLGLTLSPEEMTRARAFLAEHR